MCTAVTTDAVLDVGDSFLAMLGDDPGLLVLMAAIAGVLLVVAAQVTGRAGGVVIAVEQEISAVVEGSRFPVRRLVACCTCQLRTAVQVILRSRVTRLAIRARINLQQSVVELHCTGFRQPRSGVITMAGHAVGFGQRLMERWAPLRLRDGHTLGGAQANVRYGVAGGAAVGRGPLKRRVARKAIALQPRMRRDQVARADHFMWPGEAEVDDYRQYQRNPDPD